MVSPIAAITNPDSSINQASGAGMIQRVTQAIKQASARTGVDFTYLLNKASQESGFNPNAQSSSSSATGLFQFTSQTWLQTVKNYGSQFGLGQYANQISVDNNGVAHVSDPNMRHAILALRKDPAISAEMAGELDKENAGTLQANVGGKIGPTELYLAHFLGANGASDFIDTLRNSPKTSAAKILPDAAAANPSVFYDKSGAPKSVGQIYQQFAQKFDHAPQMPSATTMLASAATPVSSSPSTAPSAPYVTAAATNIPGLPNGATLSAASQTAPHSRSIYTAMVIAQMDMKNMVQNQLAGVTDGMTGTHKKDPILAAMGGIA